MFTYLRPALVLLAAFTLLTGLVYPLAVTGIGQMLFPNQANGSLIQRDGTVVGSRLIGQSFSSKQYFQGRPSATSDTDPNDATKTIAAPYNAANSSGSNGGPTSKALLDRIQADYSARHQENAQVPVPVDLVTASASGLDPHISPAAADFQVPRIAKIRRLPEDQVRKLVAAHTEGRWLGVFGEPAVNVLELNLALDTAAPIKP
jgi:K+-transporting ATPase ATPase C chain